MRDGNGNFQLPPGNPVVTGTVISSDDFNTTLGEVRDGLTESIAKDGQTVPTANLPMGGKKHTNCANATVRGEYATLANLQDDATRHLGLVTGGPNALIGNTTPTFTPLVEGQIFTFRKDAAANTNVVGLSINGSGSIEILHPDATHLAAGDLPASCFCIVQYTFSVFILLNEPAALLSTDAVNASFVGGVPAASFARLDAAGTFLADMGFTRNIFQSAGFNIFTPTAPAEDSSTKAATTQYVQDALAARIGRINGVPMLMHTNVAPVGWVRQLIANDYAVRINSASDMTSGGVLGFSTVFARTATDGHGLTAAENGPHTHPGMKVTAQSTAAFAAGNNVPTVWNTVTDSSGTGDLHTHPCDMRVLYLDMGLYYKA